MTSMEHAIEQAARALYAHRQAVGNFPDGLTDWGDLPEPWRIEWREAGEYVVRALADAGLISPYPLVKEWGTIDRAVDRHMWSNIAWHAKSEEHARDAAWSFGYDVLHRYRTEWMDDDE